MITALNGVIASGLASNLPPSNTIAPVISGTNVVGNTLTTTNGTWSGTAPITYTYQWKRNGSNIVGATASTYLLVNGDDGTNITCAVTGTNAAGNSTSTSNTITIAAIAPTNTVAPVISGTNVVGNTLTTTNGTWSGTAPITYTYQWKRNGSNIVSATASTYLLVNGDDGTNITCAVTGTNAAGNSTATSNTIAIAAIAPTNTVAPVISGTNVVGNTLTTTNGTWSGTAPITYTYQWKRNGSNIVSATASTYLLVQADATFDITCSVTGTNILGNSTATSNSLTIFDANAQLFIDAETAAGITLSTTQKNAVNQWVVDSKSAAIWTKMKAVYPIVGGTATAHKFNLINPADTNAAFRLFFSGGWTHSATGMLPNGTNAFSNTFFAPSVNSTSINSFHNSYYSRTNVNLTQVDSGCGSSDLQGTLLEIRTANLTYVRINAASTTNFSDTDSLGFYSQSRLSGTQQKGYKNNILKVTGTVNSNTAPSQNFYIGAYNNSNTPFYYSSKECAFASIGDGLTDLESQILYQITEKFQVALGRNINATQSFYYNSAYNNETNAFLFSTQITDATIQTATNTLVTDLKTANIFTKIKALYPIVGGTATTHKFNLINSQDTDAAYRLSFVGGWTHSSNGALPNGVNAYAETYLAMSVIAQDSGHMTYYSRSSGAIYNNRYCMGFYHTPFDNLTAIQPTVSGVQYGYMNSLGSGTPAVLSAANTLGFLGTTRLLASGNKTFKNTSISALANQTSRFTSSTTTYYIGSCNVSSTTDFFGNFECALASIGDGLTDAEVLLFRTAAQNFNTTLGRQV